MSLPPAGGAVYIAPMKTVCLLLGLILAVALSFWFAPPPLGEPNVEYWGHYVRVGPRMGFVYNHDSKEYLDVARHPAYLLRAREVRQSRPLYALLAAAVGYPLTVGLAGAGRLGLMPRWPPEQVAHYGFYGGFVALNMLALLASLLLLRHLCLRLTNGQGAAWQFYPLAWILVSTPLTKAFFWTAHQQFLALLTPLFCLALVLEMRQRAPLRTLALLGLAAGLGLLALVYGNFVLVWPALAYGIWLSGAGPAGAKPAPAQVLYWLRLGLSLVAFVLPTVLWILLLKWHGVVYYNRETTRYHQLVWLWEGLSQPLPDYLAQIGYNLARFAEVLPQVGCWVVLAGLLYGATWRRRGAAAGPVSTMTSEQAQALGWVFSTFTVFVALLGYYQVRLTYTLFPLILCGLAALLPRWPRRWAQPVALAVAASWHLYVLLSYGPFE